MEPALPPATLTAPTSPARECNPTPVLESEVFEEEVSDIAQVLCENDLFEFELTHHPPLENVKGNLRRKLEFWKRIGTSKFILNVIERGYTAISINVVGSKLQAYATRPNGSVGRSRRLPHVLNTNEV